MKNLYTPNKPSCAPGGHLSGTAACVARVRRVGMLNNAESTTGRFSLSSRQIDTLKPGRNQRLVAGEER